MQEYDASRTHENQLLVFSYIFSFKTGRRKRIQYNGKRRLNAKATNFTKKYAQSVRCYMLHDKQDGIVQEMGVAKEKTGQIEGNCKTLHWSHCYHMTHTIGGGRQGKVGGPSIPPSPLPYSLP